MNELATIDTMIQQTSEGFAKTLSQYKWELLPDSQLQAAKQALTKNDYIMKIATGDTEAVHDSLMKAAILGLDLTEGKKQGWLLPRKNQQGKAVIVLQVGYKGVEAVHQRMGVIDRLSIRTVRENDDFTWSGDDSEKPVHEAKPNWFASNEERGSVSGAFAITYFPNGSTSTVVAPISVIFGNHRDRSDSYKSYLTKKAKGGYAHPPPWVSDEQSMIEKTMAFIAAKQWPANNRDNGVASKILETLHEIDISDYSLSFTSEQRDAFIKFVEAEDSLGLYIFTQLRIEIETYAAIHKQYMQNIERGGKGKVRDHINMLVRQGHDLFDDIIEGLNNDDEFKVVESMDGSLVVTSKLVISTLSDSQKVKFVEMMREDESPETGHVDHKVIEKVKNVNEST
jgi:recombination protein RecT